MCANPFKTPKAPKAAPPPAPPAPPPAAAPKAPALSEEAETAENDRGRARMRRIGRSALRIDLQGPATRTTATTAGSTVGLQAPKS